MPEALLKRVPQVPRDITAPPMPPAQPLDAVRPLDANRFLTADRVDAIGERIAPLVLDDLSWVERRKESVKILDDTALRRQVSADFSLRSTCDPLLEGDADGGHEQALYCAPVYVLPKSSGNLMAFDLKDESSRALHLIARGDNARISAAALVRMAERVLQPFGATLPDGLRDLIRLVAESDATDAQQIYRRLAEGPVAPWPEALLLLRWHERFAWWLATLAHSSIVVVLYRAAAPGRKLVKLTFEEPIRSKQRFLTRLGWAPYKVAIESSMIDARSYHFEAEAPPGLRIRRASLTDDGHDDAVTEQGFLRRVHLYRRDAPASGAATAVLWIAVSSPGFISGAAIASCLTFAALAACAYWAPNISANPTSAPALLLVLPGLIASYIARPDQHALTSRLLAWGRRMLMLSALCAYIAAAKVALGGDAPRTDIAKKAAGTSLRDFLVPLVIVAAVPCAALVATRLRTLVRGYDGGQGGLRLRDRRFVPLSRHVAFQRAKRDTIETLTPQLLRVIGEPDPGTSLLAKGTTVFGDWSVHIEVEELGGSSMVTVTADYASRLPRGFGKRLARRRKARAISRALDGYAT